MLCAGVKTTGQKRSVRSQTPCLMLPPFLLHTDKTMTLKPRSSGRKVAKHCSGKQAEKSAYLLSVSEFQLLFIFSLSLSRSLSAHKPITSSCLKQTIIPGFVLNMFVPAAGPVRNRTRVPLPA